MTSKRRLIGLTGGISTGKTTVAKYLANAYKLPILDADIYAREAVAVGTKAINAIASRYGEQVLLADGSLNRQQLGAIVFNNDSERHWLEGQIHPEVRDRFIQEMKQLSTSSIVLVIPLLFEAQMTDLVTEIWVVYCPKQQQLARLIERDRLTTEAAEARINSQMPIEEKCDRADIILDNSSTLKALLQQVDAAIKTQNSQLF